jgi:hypothetical protein
MEKLFDTDKSHYFHLTWHTQSMISCIVRSQPLARSSKDVLRLERYLHKRRTTFPNPNLNILPGIRCLHLKAERTPGITCRRTSLLADHETTRAWLENFHTRSAIYRVSAQWTGISGTRALHASPGESTLKL